MTSKLDIIRHNLENEEFGYSFVTQLRARSREIVELELQGDDTSSRPVIDVAIDYIQQIAHVLTGWGLTFQNAEPGHSLGHLLRDFAHAAILGPKMQATRRARIAGMIAGVYHDIGNCLVKRYADRNRVVRHAEAGAMLLEEACIELGIPEEIRELAVLAVAAHTDYRNEQEIVCSDGKIRYVMPYRDCYVLGSKVRSILLTRMVDRLDCNGPTFVGRHFLTLAEDHDDFSPDNGFYSVTFDEHMRPLLRDPELIKEQGGKRTMREHLKMFVDSQCDSSYYGENDTPHMRMLRDYRSIMLNQIIGAHSVPARTQDLEMILEAWENHLVQNIEPVGEPVRKATSVLIPAMRRLHLDTQLAWAKAFAMTMGLYTSWYDSVTEQVASEGVSEDFALFGVKLSDMLRPDPFLRTFANIGE